jgi:hypothetical protein
MLRINRFRQPSFDGTNGIVEILQSMALLEQFMKIRVNSE